MTTTPPTVPSGRRTPVPQLLLLGGWGLAVAWLTLRSAPEAAALVERTPWHCLMCGGAGAADVLQNILLFVPLGLGLCAIGLAFWPAFGVALATTLGIELSQAYLLVGRDATLGDVVMNTAGGMIGWLTFPYRQALLSPPPHVARWLAPTMLAMFGLQLVATSLLLTPAVDPPGPWALRIAPQADHREQFEGTVTAVALNGAQVKEDAPRPELALGGPATFEVAVGWVPPRTPRTAPMVRLEHGDNELVAAADAKAGALGIELRLKAADYRLRVPTWTVPPPSTAPGDTFAFAVTVARGTVTVSTRSSAEAFSRYAPLGAQHGWVLINPFTPRHDLGPSWTLWTLAWLAGWGVLLGWSAAGTGHARRWAVAALVVLVAVTSWGGAVAGVLEWVAVLGGSEVGRRITSRRRSP